jgi:hypothetical protein
LKRNPVFLALLGVAALSSCNFPQSATLSPLEIQTSAAQTAAAIGGQGQPAAQNGAGPTATAQPAPPTGTPQPTSTFTPPATVTPTPTNSPTPLPCNWAQYVSDVTYPDDTAVPPSWTIEKTWRLKNIGTCAWTSGYQLIFDHGNPMGAPASQQLTSGTVAPGATVDVTVTLHTPAADGTYQGYYKLKSADGRVFGIGASADGAFWVRVEVQHKVDFSAAYSNVHYCGTSYSTAFQIGNSGNVGLESVQVRLFNSITDVQLGSTFTGNNPWLPTAASCLPGADGPIGPGSTWFLAVNFFPPLVVPASGLRARVFIKACTEDGLGGECVEKPVEFTYP